jgi:hypothetical protein
MTVKAGETISLGGVLSGLDGATVWGIASSMRERDNEANVAALEASLTPTTDFATSGNYAVFLYGSSAVTAPLAPAATQNERVWLMDIRIFDIANPDPVLFSDTIVVRIQRAISQGV